MSYISGQTHSFDISLASKFGIGEAILIHHFQHWIRVNRSKDKNIHEGRCWTYQSRTDIQGHFPYFTYKQVRKFCEQLVHEGVLVVNNFHTNKMNHKLWYAFKDEALYKVDEEFVNNLYDLPKRANRSAQMGTSISDTILKDTKDIRSERASAGTDSLKKKKKELMPSADKPLTRLEDPNSEYLDPFGHQQRKAEIKGSLKKEFGLLSEEQQKTFQYLLNVPAASLDDEGTNPVSAMKLVKDHNCKKIFLAIGKYCEKKKSSKVKIAWAYMKKICEKMGKEDDIDYRNNKEFWSNSKHLVRNYREYNDFVDFPQFGRDISFMMSHDNFKKQFHIIRQLLEI